MKIMKKWRPIFLKIFLIGVLTSCSFNEELISIRMIYGPPYATVIIPITCSSIEYDLLGVERKKVSENDFLQKVEREVEKLVESDKLATKSVDVRIKSFLDYGDKTDTLCLGEFSGVILNGQLMEDNATLLELFKSNIYVDQE